MIRPNCRLQFTPEDIEFIHLVLGKNESAQDSLGILIKDPESLDIILDDKRLLKTVLESPGCLKISPHLYFYILVRNVFLKSGIKDVTLTDYIAELLTEYARSDRSRKPIESSEEQLNYFTDVLVAMEKADEKMRFFIQLFVGNYTLFISGIFPGHLQYRTQYRAAPEIEYYENLGISNYRSASNHRLAQKYNLKDILLRLSEYYRSIRLALNDLSQRLVILESPAF